METIIFHPVNYHVKAKNLCFSYRYSWIERSDKGVSCKLSCFLL